MPRKYFIAFHKTNPSSLVIIEKFMGPQGAGTVNHRNVAWHVEGAREIKALIKSICRTENR